MTDTRRLEVCWTLSLSLHMAAVFTYIQHHLKHKENLPMISEVEFAEPFVEELTPPQPAQEAPKNVIDFLKMALPKFNKPQPLPDLQEVEAPKDKKDALADIQPEKIDLKKGMLESKPELQLDKRASKTESLSDIAALQKSKAATPDQLAETLNLEEVGRKAVAPPPSFGEQIDLKKQKITSLQDQVMPTATRSAPRDTGIQDAGISLRKGPSSRPSAMPAAQPSVTLGYSKGTGRGLKEAVIPPPAIAAPKVESKLQAAEPSKKNVEISGPLSSRKIIRTKMPLYPAWAREQGISADVVVQIYVSPQGQIREKMKIARTSGYSELDRLAMEALKGWAFEPKDLQMEDEWGYVTFRYVLD